jgi:methionine-rich copper-binding protein CopC
VVGSTTSGRTLLIMRAFLKIALTCLTASLLIAVGTSVVQAHAALTSSNPEDGSTLSAPPTVIDLTFNEELLPDTVEIAVTTEAAGLIAGIEFTTAGPTVQVTWPQDLPDDTYQVAYRVVSNDGHPITGAISFSYSGSGAPATTESEIVVSESTESTETTETPAVPETEPETEPTGISPIWLIVGGLVIGAVIGYVMWRRASGRVSS